MENDFDIYNEEHMLPTRTQNKTKQIPEPLSKKATERVPKQKLQQTTSQQLKLPEQTLADELPNLKEMRKTKNELRNEAQVSSPLRVDENRPTTKRQTVENQPKPPVVVVKAPDKVAMREVLSSRRKKSRSRSRSPSLYVRSGKKLIRVGQDPQHHRKTTPPPAAANITELNLLSAQIDSLRRKAEADQTIILQQTATLEKLQTILAQTTIANEELRKCLQSTNTKNQTIVRRPNRDSNHHRDRRHVDIRKRSRSRSRSHHR